MFFVERFCEEWVRRSFLGELADHRRLPEGRTVVVVASDGRVRFLDCLYVFFVEHFGKTEYLGVFLETGGPTDARRGFR